MKGFNGAMVGTGLLAAVLSMSVAFALRMLSRRRGDASLCHAAVPAPLAGPAAVAAFLIVTVAHPALVIPAPVAALLIGTALLGIVGLIDDRRILPWQHILLAQLLAAVVLLVGGVRLFYINGPFGSAIRLDQWNVQLPNALCAQASSCTFPLLGSLLIIGWVVAVTNAYNWLDGSDGVASSVGTIAFLVLAALALTNDVFQPPLAILAVAAAGAVGGTLPLTYPPARLLLGNAGSFSIGFLLVSLSVLAGAKLATLAMVLLLPAADACAVIADRVRRRAPIVGGDTRHLHHVLMRRGWKPRRILLAETAVTVLFGAAAILLSRPWKLIVLGTAFIGMTAALAFMKFRVRE